VSSMRAINIGVHIGNVSHYKLIINITAFSTLLLLSLFYTNCSNDAPNILTQTRVGEAEIERFRGSDGHVSQGQQVQLYNKVVPIRL